MAPRTGDEPDPPMVDFSDIGAGLLDMTNIDFKFPSEHTVCGTRFDGEMQYYIYNAGRRRFVAVSFFLEGECISKKVNVKHNHSYHRPQADFLMRFDCSITIIPQK